MDSLQNTLDERGNNYGDFGEMASLSQTLKTMLISDRMSNVQRESIDLICTKLARISCGNPNHKDSWVDIGGYAMLAARHLP